MLKIGLDMCSKRGDVIAAIQLFDLAQREGIKMGQYHYAVLLYLCSSATTGVVQPAKSGSGISSRSLSLVDFSTACESSEDLTKFGVTGTRNFGTSELNMQVPSNGLPVESGDIHESSDKQELNIDSSHVAIAKSGKVKTNQFSNGSIELIPQTLNGLIRMIKGNDGSSNTKYVSGGHKDYEIQVSEDVKKFARERGFEIYEKMLLEKNILPLGYVPGLNEVWCGRTLQLKGFNFLQWLYDAWAAKCSASLYFFDGEGSRNNDGDGKKSQLDTSRKGSFNGRGLTNVLIAINVLAYLAQIATQGKLMLWGAKINSLIDQGQLWRLVSSSFLHANIGHLMVNCYSLNSIGPTMEKISGTRRYMAVYISSAIASSAMSYWLCKAPAVGASGAIFGLVGSYAMFILRHRNLTNDDGMGDLQHIARLIVLNMVIGFLAKGIDNWGHLGGLIGGFATSWFLGPALKYEFPFNEQQGAFVDKAPIFSLIKTQRKP